MSIADGILDASALSELGAALRQDIGVSIEIPDFGWDLALYPVEASITSGGWAICSLTLLDFAPGWEARPRYWVDVSKANDTGDGLTEATAKRTGARAIELCNAGGVPAVIMCKGNSFWNANRLFSQGGARAAVDILAIAYEGRITLATQAPDLVFTANATYAHVTQTNRNSVSRVFDTRAKTRDGGYVELRKLATLEAVAATPNSWAEVSNTTYINRADRLAAADANTRILLAIDNIRLDGVNQTNFILAGLTERDGFDVEGGQAGGWRTLYTGGVGGRRVVHGAKNCSFRYSGHSANAIGGVAIEGLNGLAFFDNCDASFGVTDCFNFHNALGAEMYALTVNCSGLDGGRFSYVSCNGWTLHEDVVGMDLGGIYEGNRGRNVHLIGTSAGFMAGARIDNSLGDRPAGGANDPGEVTVEDNATIYLDYCKVGSLSGQLGLAACENGSIRHRRSAVRGISYAEPTAVIEAY